MAVTDYSTTPGDNTDISGINIGENCPRANINNAIRQLMADIASYVSGLDTSTGNQPADATLTALAALTTAADKLIYATGSDAFSTTDFPSAGRTLVGKSTTAEMLTYLGTGAISVSGTSASGYLTLGSFKLQWKDATVTASSSDSVSYPTAFSSWSRAWFNGDDTAVHQNNPPYVSGTSVSAATVRNQTTTSVSGTVFAIGV